MRARSLIAIAAMVLASPLAAAPLDYLPSLQGDYFRLDSATLQRPFHIYVRLPADYATSGKTYPVVYLLDGDSLFPMLAPLHLFLTYDEPVPEAIVVGLAYGSFDPAAGNRRDTDYRAPPLDDGDASGGAAAFQRMLRDEALPAVESRYRVDPSRRILVGQSHGGQFVLYSALTAPDMFWGRIVSNASMKPNVDAFYDKAARAKRRDLRLFYASGERDRPHLRAEALKWSAAWSGRPRPWALKFETIEGGTHAASIGRVYRDAMVWLFEDAPASEDDSR